MPNSLQVECGAPVWTWKAEALRVRELHLAVQLGLENSPGVEADVGKVLCLSLCPFTISLPFCDGSALFSPFGWPTDEFLSLSPERARSNGLAL